MTDWIERYYQKQRETAQKGGEGSGHHGHAGRPGKRGGSLPGKGGVAESSGASGRKNEPWAMNVRQWLDTGHLPPPEMYNGLDSNRGGIIQVERYADGTYTVVHDMGGVLKQPYVTKGNYDMANDSVQRLYGGPLNRNVGDMIGQHRKLVKEAMARGDKVPDDVLADYPDLKR